MKILVIQLARLGDIYQTWPVFSAIKRSHPEAELHVMVRDRFKEALNGNANIDEVVVFDTAKVLSGIIIDENEELSLKETTDFCERLKNSNYDKIINLSFSPFSSYLVSSISNENTKVSGYTRYSDGYLCIPDDVSAYFYAQVGVGKSNRVHLSHVFAGVCGVELVSEDWNHDNYGANEETCLALFNLISKKYVLLQVGASQQEKTYGVNKWSQVINHFKKHSDLTIVLIGTKSEAELAEQIMSSTVGSNTLNLVGKTHLDQLSQLTKAAALVMSGDSLLLHIASLTQTPALCVSLSTVNFWETGPLAPGSRLIFGDTPDDIASDRVAFEAYCMLEGKTSGNPIMRRISYGPVAYDVINYKFDNFSWHLIEALYMQGAFPIITDADLALGMKRLNELAQLAIQQLNEIHWNKKLNIQVELLSQVDTMLEIIPKLVPPLEPLLSWFQTERVRIGPAIPEQVLSMTKTKFTDLKIITDLYSEATEDSGGLRADTNILP